MSWGRAMGSSLGLLITAKTTSKLIRATKFKRKKRKKKKRKKKS